VHEPQVDVVERHRRQGLLERRPLAADVLGRHLGRHEDAVAGDAAAVDRPAHVLLVAVSSGGVDMPVARVQRPADGVARRAAVQPPGAEPDQGDLATSGQPRVHVVG
jgi:hypothetical protein